MSMCDKISKHKRKSLTTQYQRYHEKAEAERDKQDKSHEPKSPTRSHHKKSTHGQ